MDRAPGIPIAQLLVLPQGVEAPTGFKTATLPSQVTIAYKRQVRRGEAVLVDVRLGPAGAVLDGGLSCVPTPVDPSRGLHLFLKSEIVIAASGASKPPLVELKEGDGIDVVDGVRDCAPGHERVLCLHKPVFVCVCVIILPYSTVIGVLPK